MNHHTCCRGCAGAWPELPIVANGRADAGSNSSDTYAMYTQSLLAAANLLLIQATADGIHLDPWGHSLSGMYVAVSISRSSGAAGGPDPVVDNFTAVDAITDVAVYGRLGCVDDDFLTKPRVLDQHHGAPLTLTADTGRLLAPQVGTVALVAEKRNGKATVLRQGAWAPGALTPDAIAAVAGMAAAGHERTTLAVLAEWGHAAAVAAT